MIKVGIAHAAWSVGRKESVRRLSSEVGHSAGQSVTVLVSNEREHARVWAPRLWRWVAEQQGGAPCVLLNDDVTLCPRFVEACEAIAQAHPGRFVSLHGQGADLLRVAREGHRFARCYSYTGPGVLMYPAQARELLAFAEARADLWETQNEDGLANVWLWSKQEPALVSIPALVRHDVSVPSTLGYDCHAMRTSSVDWGGDWPDLLPIESIGPLIANPWMPDAVMHALSRPRETGHSRARVVIATPTHGTPCTDYVATMMKLVTAGQRGGAWEVLCRFSRNDSIVHARSSLVREFLETDGTHLLFVDDDQSFEPHVLAGMLATGHDFVACPYPRREGVNWDLVREHLDVPPEALAYRYNVTLMGHPDAPALAFDDATKCAEVVALGFGCVLLTRRACELMVRAYGESLGYLDLSTHKQTTALFQLELADGTLYGEDVSFCRRWRAIGGRVWMYLGEGSPIDHHGAHRYRGALEAFGLTREQEP